MKYVYNFNRSTYLCFCFSSLLFPDESLIFNYIQCKWTIFLCINHKFFFRFQSLVNVKDAYAADRFSGANVIRATHSVLNIVLFLCLENCFIVVCVCNTAENRAHLQQSPEKNQRQKLYLLSILWAFIKKCVHMIAISCRKKQANQICMLSTGGTESWNRQEEKRTKRAHTHTRRTR